MTKSELRKAIKSLKERISFKEKLEESKLVFKLVETTSTFKEAKNILLYYSLPDELPTHEIVEKWSINKQIFLPRVNGENLEIIPYNIDQLKVGSYGIKEPTGISTVDVLDIDLIIVPAVAVDANGNRLGRGKGYYDRLLSRCKNAYKIAVALDCQFIDSVPSEPHDIIMDAVITAKKQIIIQQNITRF